MTDRQPEALRLADAIDLGNKRYVIDCIDAAAELRRLHEENETLKRCLFQMQEAAKAHGDRNERHMA